MGHEVVSLRAGTTRQRATTKKPKTEEAQRANELFEFYLHEERCAYVCKYVYIYMLIVSGRDCAGTLMPEWRKRPRGARSGATNIGSGARFIPGST